MVDLRGRRLCAADQRAQKRSGVGDRQHAVRGQAQPTCFAVHPVVVGDEVVDRVHAQSGEEEVIDPVVTLGIYCSKNTLHMFDTGRIGELLVTWPTVPGAQSGAQGSGQWRVHESSRGGPEDGSQARRRAEQSLRRAECRAPGLPDWSAQAGSVRWRRGETAASIRGSPFVRLLAPGTRPLACNIRSGRPDRSPSTGTPSSSSSGARSPPLQRPPGVAREPPPRPRRCRVRRLRLAGGGCAGRPGG